MTKTSTAPAEIAADGYCREAKLNTTTWAAIPCQHGNVLSHRIEAGLPESTDGR